MLIIFLALFASDTIVPKMIHVSADDGTLLKFVGTGSEKFALWQGTLYSTSAEYHDVQRYGELQNLSWGQDGRGPADLNNPRSIVVNHDGVWILNLQPNKVVHFSHDGTFQEDFSIKKGFIVTEFKPYRDGFLINSKSMAGEQTLIYFDRKQEHIVRELEGAGDLIIEPNKGPIPRFRLGLPYQSQLWSPQGSHLLFWDTKTLGVYDENLKPFKEIPLPISNYPITEQDKKRWLDEQFPEGTSAFGHNNIWEPIRKIAEEQVTFPAVFPSVIQIYTTSAQVWVCVGYQKSAQHWLHITADKSAKLIVLPKAHQLVAVGDQSFATLSDAEEPELRLFKSKF